ncbi:DNA cytosine methyltransferase [Elusimicrobiota bacterium]
MPKLTAISLFSGAGGIDYGLEAAGFDTAVALEFNRDCCRTLRANRSWPVIEEDVFAVTTRQLLKIGQLKKGQVDLLVGGPPCQPFSKSAYWNKGDTLRLQDPRAGTLAAYMRVVEEAQPRAFLLENVGGMTFSGKSEGFSFLLQRIREINKRTHSKYRPCWKILNAAHFGVPQKRERFFLIAARDGSQFEFPVPTHEEADREGDLLPSGLFPFSTAWDAIGDVRPERQENLKVGGKWGELLPSIPEGKNYLWHTPRGGGLPLFGWRTRYWQFLLKLAKTQPSWTIQAQPGSSVGPFHWENRRLSSRELCRLQTFPDNVTISGSRVEVQRQIGNAVPSLFAEVLARAIRTQLLKRRITSPRPALMPKKRNSYPRPVTPKPVPKKYRELIGDHADHPGTGKGKAAVRRLCEAT